jgi:hypothetical protein
MSFIKYNKNIINKHWYTIKEIEDYLINYCNINNYKNILEIGPGLNQFPLATKFVGYNENINNYISIDIDEEKLPFKDKELDFIYSRHVLEDVQNPNFALKEIVRCCKSGYIETPSPLIEITKGIDGHNDSDKYCGYLHHRYIIWSDIEKCEMYFLPKYSCIIDNFMELYNPVDFYKIVNDKPLYWNNYFIWKDKQPKIVMYKNGINFHLNVENYIILLNDAINKSITNTNFFIKNNLNLYF